MSISFTESPSLHCQSKLSLPYGKKGPELMLTKEVKDHIQKLLAMMALLTMDK